MTWVIVTGKGSAYIVNAPSAAQASFRFQKKYPGHDVAQCFEASILLWDSNSDNSATAG